MDVAFNYMQAFADQTFVLFAFLFGLALANVFVPPVPIESISLFAGALSGLGNGNPILMWIALSTGMAAGSTLLFWLARSQGRRLMQLAAIRKQVTSARLAQAEHWFRRYGVWTIYAGKLVPGMSFATVLASGLFGVDRKKALAAIYLANFLYFAVTVGLGYVLGDNWTQVVILGKRYWPWGFGGLIVAGGVLYTYHLHRKR